MTIHFQKSFHLLNHLNHCLLLPFLRKYSFGKDFIDSAKKKTLFPGNVGDEKNFHPICQNFFSFDFAFLYSCFFCLFVCFLKLEIYILIHI